MKSDQQFYLNLLILNSKQPWSKPTEADFPSSPMELGLNQPQVSVHFHSICYIFLICQPYSLLSIFHSQIISVYLSCLSKSYRVNLCGSFTPIFTLLINFDVLFYSKLFCEAMFHFSWSISVPSCPTVMYFCELCYFVFQLLQMLQLNLSFVWNVLFFVLAVLLCERHAQFILWFPI